MLYVILAAVVVLLLIVGNVWRSKRKEKKKQYDQKLKEEALSESLKNERKRRNGFGDDHQAQSVDQVIRQERLVERNQVIVRLTVSGSQNADYVLSPEKHIFIGKASGRNEIVLDGNGIADRQCEIFLHNNGQVYVQNLYPSYPVVLRRKSSQKMLDGQAICVITGDRIQIGNYKISVTMMDYVGNTIRG